jgi:hypothetical protein
MPEPVIKFPWSEPELAERVRAAGASYWAARSGQSDRQRESGVVSDTGARSEVTGGKHLDGFCDLLCELIRAAGFDDSEIGFQNGVELPGFYRPLKKWDIVVTRDGRLCAALELKSQVGPSFGNNFNNRSEEAIGSSTDFWTAFREGAMGSHQPWLGYFLLVEDADKSRSPVRLAKAVFEPMKIFHGTSYLQRYAILCQRLVQERNYNAASLIIAPRGSDGCHTQPEPALSFHSFAKSLFGHLIGAA